MGEHHLILEVNAPLSFRTRIPRVPITLRDKPSSFEHFQPAVVCLGPYHHFAARFPMVEYIKPSIANMLVSCNSKTLDSLYASLAGMIKELKGYYDKDDELLKYFSDADFTRMMLLDGCFLLSFINYIFSEYEISSLITYLSEFIQRDIFLMENQIPYQVLIEVMKFVPDPTWDFKINRFIDNLFFVKGSFHDHNDPIPSTTTHLLEHLQTRVTKEKGWSIQVGDMLTSSCNVRKLYTKEWIRFKTNRSGSLASINFVRNWFFSYLELPRITVDKNTECVLLNLLALERYFGPSWITMYLCLLDSLIDHSEDVTILRKAVVLKNLLGSDRQVADMFNKLARDLTPANFKVEFVIHKHYDSKGKLKLKYD